MAIPFKKWTGKVRQPGMRFYRTAPGRAPGAFGPAMAGVQTLKNGIENSMLHRNIEMR